MKIAKVKNDVRQLKKWATEIENLADKELDSFLLESVKMLAGKFIENVMERTPIGNYPALTGKEGGHLRASWKIAAINKISGGYEVEIYNNASAKNGDSYASHVEYGHRIVNRYGELKGFTRGKFMMTNTEIEMAFIAPELLEAQFEAFLKQVFGDG